MAESLETQLEKGINGVLNGEQAVIAREYLSKGEQQQATVVLGLVPASFPFTGG